MFAVLQTLWQQYVFDKILWISLFVCLSVCVCLTVFTAVKM